MSDMPKAYEPEQYEDEIYKRWEESGSFIPENLPNFAERKPYTIILPPPNATGTLHVGHALGNTIQDVLIRYKRMNGFRTLWVPGTDHAALATQNRVEKDLWAAEKKTRHDLGREEFLRRVDEFVEINRSRMTYQMRKLGSSLDWSRELFTLDEGPSRAVRTVFKKMYDDGIMYRGNRVVNWCARCASTLSDDEVETKTRTAILYYFKYAADFPITIASTQPETKLGDTAVAVHPSDERYKNFIGKIFDIAFGGTGGAKLKIKIIADHTVEKDFGTGALGVTPAHSMVDYLMALQYELPLTQIIGEDGHMVAAAGSAYVGLTVKEVRAKVVEWLRAENLIEKEEEISQNVPVCSRCETEITPLPKLQWFVAVNKKFAFRQSTHAPIAGFENGQDVSLKDAMSHVVKTEQIKILPDRFEKTYFHWVDNLRDWCVSRQIWYGHRIPVWYCTAKKTPECGAPMCSVETVVVCPHCRGNVEQDPDVLDTWFSSGTWTFSTLGWPYTRVIFVRHGEGVNNAEDVMNSSVHKKEYGLTERGVEQVRATAQKLRREGATQIIASPLVRTQQTAQILAEELGLSVRTDDRLSEVGMGMYEGRPFAEFRAAIPHRDDVNTWMHEAPDGMETFSSLRSRTYAFMEDVLREYRGRTVIVVTHGDPIYAMVKFGLSGVEYVPTYPPTAGYTICEFDANGSQRGDLQMYHPTDVLEGAYEILFNWMARMILMTTYALGEVPFRTIYLHGLVRDEQGRKMSKSLKNGIDPLDVIPKYGTDALRLALLLGQTPGNDSRISEEKIAGFRNFANKLWNIARYVGAQDGDAIDGRQISHAELAGQPLTVLDQWILSRLAGATRDASAALEKFEFSRAGELLRDFTWNELADWYIEGAKVEGGKQVVLHFILQQLLKLWHPFVPFVTETIWQSLYASGPEDFLMIAVWPDFGASGMYPEAELEFGRVQKIITAIRALRADFKVAPKEIVAITVVSKFARELALHQPVIEKLARCELLFADAAPSDQLAAVIEEGTITMPRPVAESAAADDTEKLKIEHAEVTAYIARMKEKLANIDFVSRAPATVIEKEREKIREAEEKLAAIAARIGG